MEKLDKIKPLLRFPAFIQDREWKEQKFGGLFAFLPNNTLSRADLKEGKGDVYNVHYGDVLIKLDAYTDIQRDKLPAIKTVDDIEKYILHLLLSPLIKKAGLYVFIIGGYKLLLIAIIIFSFFL